MNNDLKQYTIEKIKHLTMAIDQSAFTAIRDRLVEEKAMAEIALKAMQSKPTFEEWMSTQSEKIEVDCGCVTTEAFYHWLKVAYEDTPQPAHTEHVGWIKCSDDLPLIGVEVQVYIPGNAQTGRPTVTAMARFIKRQGAPDYFWDKSTGKGGMTLDASLTHWRPLASAPKPESE